MEQLLAFLVIAVFYAGVWLALAMLLSIVFRSSATAALVALGIWLFLTVLCGNDTRYESDYRDHGGLRADVRILRALLDSGAEPTRAVLAEAVSCNHTLAMRALVRAGADPTTVTPGRFVEPETRQALKELIGKHHRRVLRDAQDADGAPVAMRSRSRL